MLGGEKNEAGPLQTRSGMVGMGYSSEEVPACTQTVKMPDATYSLRLAPAIIEGILRAVSRKTHCDVKRANPNRPGAREYHLSEYFALLHKSSL
jgi:hypothetical protein